jgi:hypothetical protein
LWLELGSRADAWRHGAMPSRASMEPCSRLGQHASAVHGMYQCVGCRLPSRAPGKGRPNQWPGKAACGPARHQHASAACEVHPLQLHDMHGIPCQCRDAGHASPAARAAVLRRAAASAYALCALAAADIRLLDPQPEPLAPCPESQSQCRVTAGGMICWRGGLQPDRRGCGESCPTWCHGV